MYKSVFPFLPFLLALKERLFVFFLINELTFAHHSLSFLSPSFF